MHGKENRVKRLMEKLNGIQPASEAPRLFIHHEADGTFQDFKTRGIVSRDVIGQRQEGILADIILIIES